MGLLGARGSLPLLMGKEAAGSFTVKGPGE